MATNIVRAVVTSLGFMIAYVLLSPLGLGWLVILAFLAYLGFSLYRVAQQVSPEEEDDDGERPMGRSVGGETLRRLRERGARPSRSESVEERDRQARERARREADCGLTHEERVRFHDIIQRLNDDKA